MESESDPYDEFIRFPGMDELYGDDGNELEMIVEELYEDEIDHDFEDFNDCLDARRNALQERANDHDEFLNIRMDDPVYIYLYRRQGLDEKEEFTIEDWNEYIISYLIALEKRVINGGLDEFLNITRHDPVLNYFERQYNIIGFTVLNT